MNASPRMKKELVGGAALVAFGIAIPANAAPDGVPGPPSPGTVGKASEHANPPGQGPNDRNNGFTCDGNQGVGKGNPALNPSCGAGGSTQTPPATTTPTDPGPGTGSDTGSGPGTGSGSTWTPGNN